MGSFNGGIVHAALIDVARPTQMCVTPSGSSPNTKRYGFPSCHRVGLCCWWLFLHQRQSQSSQASITDQGPALARNCQIGSTCQELSDWQCQTLSFTDEATTGVLASRVWFNCYYYFSVSWIIQLCVCISVCVYVYSINSILLGTHGKLPSVGIGFPLQATRNSCAIHFKTIPGGLGSLSNAIKRATSYHCSNCLEVS